MSKKRLPRLQRRLSHILLLQQEDPRRIKVGARFKEAQAGLRIIRQEAMEVSAER